MGTLICYTLIDITQTGVTNPAFVLHYQQYQNFNTFLQCIGFVAPPLNVVVERLDNQNLIDYGFGSCYNGKAVIWKLTWNIETTVEIDEFKSSANGIPIHTSLNESVELPLQVLESQNLERCNLYFTRNSNMLKQTDSINN